MDLTNEDVADVLALLDSLPYDELDLQTTRFRLTLRRTPDGWTQSTQVLSEPNPLPTTPMAHRSGHNDTDGPSASSDAGVGGADEVNGKIGDGGETAGGRREDSAGTGVADQGRGKVSGSGEADGEPGEGPETAELGLVAVRAPLPGTFYRAPRPGAPPFVELGSRVSADTVIGIVETMKLMNSVVAGIAGTVAEICLANAEFAAHGATLLRIRADP
jgi:acetyl-CoA carboxylase biotin carboxyl carrier protein